MDYPKVSENDIQERIGVHQAALSLTKLGVVFRETPNTDVGIDGQIEYVLENKTIGRLAAVQIKSGKSYLIDKGDHFAFYPKNKHRAYWESFPLPVLLMLHDPETGKVYFSDARYYLSIPDREKKYSYIPVFKEKEISRVNKEELFGLPELTGSTLLPVSKILKELVLTRNNSASFPINYFDLFVNGLTNLCRYSFFSMSLASQIAEANLSLLGLEFGLGVGYSEHEFLNKYVSYMYSQKLIKIDYSDYLIDWKEREMLPEFLAPLTQRGRDLVVHIRQLEEEVFGKDDSRITVACERFLGMIFAPSDVERLSNIFEFSQNAIEVELDDSLANK